MRVIISLTTLPCRLEKETIIPTLKSVNKQSRKADAIYLGLPKISRRLGTPYPEASDEIKKLCTIVQLEKDYGPVCKILAGLYMENDPSTIIITIDDDNLYPEDFIEKMLEKHQEKPKVAIGSSGAFIGKFPGYFTYIRNKPSERYNYWWGPPIPPEGIKTDILCGYSGVLYTRNMFPTIQLTYPQDGSGRVFQTDNIKKEFLQIPLKNEDLFLHDDVYISSYLNSKGIERRLYIMPEVILTEQHESGLSDDSWKFVQSFVRAVKASHDHGLIREKTHVKPIHTIGGRVLFFIMLAIILIIVLIYIYRILYSSSSRKK